MMQRDPMFISFHPILQKREPCFQGELKAGMLLRQLSFL